MESYPLLETPAAMAGVLDYKGRPITKPSSGRWVAASFILGMEMAERVAYNGILFNLISYMTGPLGHSAAAAASAVSFWSAATLLLPFLGALLADSFLSRYRTIVVSSLLYVLGLGLLALSAALPNQSGDESKDRTFSPPTTFKVVLFYFSIYLVAFAEGGHRPCVQAFGADQFDEMDKEECLWRSSFFNWWIFGLGLSLTVSPIALSYVQDNVNWGLGFGIPCVLLGSALIVFLMGSRFYRCYALKETTPFDLIGRAFVKFFKGDFSPDCPVSSDQSKLLSIKLEAGGENLMAEETKTLLPLFPIWATCLSYSVTNCQWETFFTKQAATLNRNITPTIQIPAAGLQSLTNLTITILIVFYDRLAVPLTRKITAIPSGITMLQRIGVGLLLSAIVMVVSALVEMKRLQIARSFGLKDEPFPMSILWLFPQYILVGVSSVFVIVGLQEFFYDQVPDSLRSFGVALCLSIYGIGSFINGFLVYVTDEVTRRIGGESWFSDDLNEAHLDYFYWVIASMGLCSFFAFVFYARCYVYKKKRGINGV